MDFEKPEAESLKNCIVSSILCNYCIIYNANGDIITLKKFWYLWKNICILQQDYLWLRIKKMIPDNTSPEHFKMRYQEASGDNEKKQVQEYTV